MKSVLRPLGLVAIAAIGIVAHAEVAGIWALTSEGPRGTNRSELTIERTEDGYHGVLEGQRGTRKLPAINVDGDSFSFELTMQTRMGDIDLSYTGTVSGDTVSGTIATPMGERPFSGTRKAVEPE